MCAHNCWFCFLSSLKRYKKFISSRELCGEEASTRGLCCVLGFFDGEGGGRRNYWKSIFVFPPPANQPPTIHSSRFAFDIFHFFLLQTRMLLINLSYFSSLVSRGTCEREDERRSDSKPLRWSFQLLLPFVRRFGDGLSRFAVINRRAELLASWLPIRDPPSHGLSN